MSNIGLLVSRKGVNARDARPEEILFDSRKNTMKYKRLDKCSEEIVYTYNPASPGQVETKDVVHNLGYKPRVLGVAKNDVTGKFTSFPGEDVIVEIPIFPYYEEKAWVGWVHKDNNTIQLEAKYEDTNATEPKNVTFTFYFFILLEGETGIWK